MFIIVGLGNPGPKFNYTRHNSGFMAVDFFAQQNGFPKFTFSKKYNSLISEHNDITLVKPQTFMNESGSLAKALFQNSKFKIQNLIVVHDDTDLPLGKIKFAKDSGAGGHKGVESIIQNLGNNNFIRLKIGVATDNQKAIEVVLQKFSSAEKIILKEILKNSFDALQYLIDNGIEKAMNKFN